MSMSKVKCLHESFRVRQSSDENHDVHDLMAGADEIEALGKPFLRNLEGSVNS
jgi:hypothetical protein